MQEARPSRCANPRVRKVAAATSRSCSQTGRRAFIGSGAAYGFSQSAIRIHVGRGVNEAAFRDDWILVHEMTHLALPTVPRQSKWPLEGNATYVEPIAPAQAGDRPERAILVRF